MDLGLHLAAHTTKLQRKCLRIITSEHQRELPKTCVHLIGTEKRLKNLLDSDFNCKVKCILQHEHWYILWCYWLTWIETSYFKRSLFLVICHKLLSDREALDKVSDIISKTNRPYYCSYFIYKGWILTPLFSSFFRFLHINENKMWVTFNYLFLMNKTMYI